MINIILHSLSFYQGSNLALANLLNASAFPEKKQVAIPITCYLYPPQTMFVGGYTVFRLSVRPIERKSDSASVTFCFLNILKNH